MLEFLKKCFSLENIDYNSDSATIIGTILSLFFVGVTIYLTVRDKQKTKALNELEKQTASLQNSLIELLKPVWVMIPSNYTASPTFFSFQIKNIGGSCKDLNIVPVDKEIEFKELHNINSESYSSQSVINCIVLHRQKGLFEDDRKYKVEVIFNDIENRRYKQTLVLMKVQTAQQNNIHFTAPERIFDQNWHHTHHSYHQESVL